MVHKLSLGKSVSVWQIPMFRSPYSVPRFLHTATHDFRSGHYLEMPAPHAAVAKVVPRTTKRDKDFNDAQTLAFLMRGSN